MVAHNVTLFYHSDYQFGLLFNVVKSAEKRRRNALFLKNVQHPCGEFFIFPAAVEREVEHLFLRLCVKGQRPVFIKRFLKFNNRVVRLSAGGRTVGMTDFFDRKSPCVFRVGNGVGHPFKRRKAGLGIGADRAGQNKRRALLCFRRAFVGQADLCRLVHRLGTFDSCALGFGLPAFLYGFGKLRNAVLVHTAGKRERKAKNKYQTKKLFHVHFLS